MPLSHDPTLPGWLTAIAYAAACWFAASAARAAQHRGQAGWTAAAFWSGTALFMAFLALNKQLDLQTAVTDIIRRQAKAGGWYGQRREYQMLFITGMALVGLGASGALAWWVRGEPRPVKMGALGLMLTMAFVTVRAASFHHHDVMGRIEFAGLRAHVLLEWSCIALVAASAAASTRGSGPTRRLFGPKSD